MLAGAARDGAAIASTSADITIVPMRLLNPPKLDLFFFMRIVVVGLVSDGSAWDKLLDCDLSWLTSFFTGKLGTDVGLVSIVVSLSWPDVVG